MPGEISAAGIHSREALPGPAPLVIVEGFLGAALGAAFGGNFQEYLNRRDKDGKSRRRQCIFASVGPVSSLHDRACELYYVLVGGAVDYGEEHAKTHGHSRFGRTNAGLYPHWSPQHPLHFLGHSVGGPTIIKMQDLIRKGHFGHHNAHPDMVLSVTSICAPFRGTQLVYTLGERTDAAPAVRPLSVGAMIAKGVHILSFLSPFLPRSIDLHAESRALSFNQTSFLSLLRQLWKSDWAESRDATPFDVTFEAADEREAFGEGHVNPNTYCLNYVTHMTHRIGQNAGNTHSPALSHSITFPLYLSSRIMGTFDYSILKPPPSFVKKLSVNTDIANSVSADVEKGADAPSCINLKHRLGEEYWANDGVVPLFSQWHPHSCSQTLCRHYSNQSSASAISFNSISDSPAFDPSSDLDPGLWHVYQIRDAHHMSLVPFWVASERQRRFWQSLGLCLEGIERKSAERSSDN